MKAQRRRASLWQGLVVFTVLLGVLTPCVYAEPGDEETDSLLRLTLTDCIKRVLENNPSVQEVQWDVALRRSEVQQAEAGYQPTAEFDNLAGVVNDVRGSLGGLRPDGSPNFKQFGGASHLGPFTRLEGQIVYPLFTWGKLPNGVKAASKGLEQETVNVEQKKAEAVREVKEFYYTLLYTRQVEELLSDVRDGFQKAVKTADERLKEGKVTQLDVLNLRVGYAGIAKDMAKLHNGVELTRAA